MNEIWERLLQGVEQLRTIAPAVIAGSLILVVGYTLARQIERGIDKALERLDFKRMADAGGITEAVDRARAHLDPVRAVGRLLFWLMMLVVILLASAALGLESVSQMFGVLLGFLPTLISAIVIVIMGMIFGEFVRGLILASAGGVGGVITLAKIAKAVVVLIATFMALQQVGVAGEIVTSAFTLIVGAVALAVGLAFGLGNRDLAGELTRKWYEEGRFKFRRRTDQPEERRETTVKSEK